MKEITNLEAKKKAIIGKLSFIRSDLIDTLKKIPGEKLDSKISTKKDSWSVLEVVKHLFQAEYGMTTLMIGIKDGGEGVPENFDLNRYNKRMVEKLADKDLITILKDFENSRIRLFDFLETLTDQDFTKKGRHATLRVLSIEEVFNLIGDHEESHLIKIREKLKQIAG